MKAPDDVRKLAVQVGADLSAVQHKLNWLTMELEHIAEGDAGDFSLGMLRDLILGCANDLGRTALRVSSTIEGGRPDGDYDADSFAPSPTAHALGDLEAGAPGVILAGREEYAKAIGQWIGEQHFGRDKRAGVRFAWHGMDKVDREFALSNAFTPESVHWPALEAAAKTAYVSLADDTLYPVPPAKS